MSSFRGLYLIFSNINGEVYVLIDLCPIENVRAMNSS